MLSLLLCCFCFCYGDEEKKIDFVRPEPIWFVNHFWQPYCLEHSKFCPCMDEVDDMYLFEED